jgi:hypothetical protein
MAAMQLWNSSNNNNAAATIDCTSQFSLETCGFDKLAQFHQSVKTICLDLYPEEYRMYSPLCITATLQGVLADIMKSEVIEYFEHMTTISDYVNGIPSDPLVLEAEEQFEGEEEGAIASWEEEEEEDDPWEEEEEEEEDDPWFEVEDPCSSAENFVTLDDFIEHCLGDEDNDEEEEEEDP